MRCRSLIALVIVALTPAALTADTKLTVTFYSDPPGATVYQGAQNFGGAPLTLKYTLRGKFKACRELETLKFRWISGAEVEIADLQACPAAGKKQQFTVFRPTGLPGLELDAQFAIALLQQRNTTSEPASGPAAWAAAFAAGVQQQLQQPPKHCTSSVIGNQVFTNCY